MVDLVMVISAIAKMGTQVAWDKVKRRESVIKLLQQFKLDPNKPPTDFDTIYVYALIEYGVDRPEPILNFFRNEYIKEAFRQSFYQNNPSILEKEAEGIIQWNKETSRLGQIDYDPRREFIAFSAVFHMIVDNARTPIEIQNDQKLETIHSDLHQATGEILDRLNNLGALSDVRMERDRLVQTSSLDYLAQQEAITTLHQIQMTVAANYSSEQFLQDIQAYAAHVERFFHHLKIIGIVFKDKITDPELNSIFVPVRIALEDQTIAVEKRQGSITSLLERYPYLVLLGGPGS